MSVLNKLYINGLREALMGNDEFKPNKFALSHDDVSALFLNSTFEIPIYEESNVAKIMGFDFKKHRGRAVSYLEFLTYMSKYAEDFYERFDTYEDVITSFTFKGTLGHTVDFHQNPLPEPLPRLHLNLTENNTSITIDSGVKEKHELDRMVRVIKKSLLCFYNKYSIPITLPSLLVLAVENLAILTAKETTNEDNGETRISYTQKKLNNEVGDFIKNSNEVFFRFNKGKTFYRVMILKDPEKKAPYFDVVSNEELPEIFKTAITNSIKKNIKTKAKITIGFSTVKEFITANLWDGTVGKATKCFVNHGPFTNNEITSHLSINGYEKDFFHFLETNTDDVGGFEVSIVDNENKTAKVYFDKAKDPHTVYFTSVNEEFNNFMRIRLLLSKFFEDFDIKEFVFLPRDLKENETIEDIKDLEAKCEIISHTISFGNNVYELYGVDPIDENTANKRLYTGQFDLYSLEFYIKDDPTSEIHELDIRMNKADTSIVATIKSSNPSVVDFLRKYTESKFNFNLNIKYILVTDEESEEEFDDDSED